MDHLPIYLGLGALCLNNFCQHVSLISLLVALFFFFFQLVAFFKQDLYTGLVLTILLPMSSKLWSCRYMPPYAVQQISFLSRVHSDLCSCSNGEEQRHCSPSDELFLPQLFPKQVCHCCPSYFIHSIVDMAAGSQGNRIKQALPAAFALPFIAIPRLFHNSCEPITIRCYSLFVCVRALSYYTGAHVCRGQKTPRLACLFLQKKSLSLAWSSPSRIDWVASERRDFVLPLQHWGCKYAP